MDETAQNFLVMIWKHSVFIAYPGMADKNLFSKVCMIRFLLCACAFWFSGLAYACTCDDGLVPSTARVRAAKEIFIFQLVSAKVKSGVPFATSGAEIEAEIRIVDRLRGRRTFTKMTFYTGHCCGSRFDVGAHFAAFISERGPVFSAYSGNVLEVESMYSVPEARKSIAAILSGRRTLEEVFSRDELDRTTQFPVPLPCPRERSGGK